MRSARCVLSLLTLVSSAALGLAEEESSPLPTDHAAQMQASQELFKSDVRAILAGSCLDCHGGKKVEGDFSLATREALLKGGATGVAVVAGKPDDSPLLKLVRHEEEPHMPFELPKLADDAIEKLARWIALGAAYDKPFVETAGAKTGRAEVTDADRQFWSFQPLRVVAPPSVEDSAWPRTIVDRFVLAKLEAAGLRPNPAADRRKLIRRAYLDLIGLPPAPAEVEQFVSDPAPDAYERLVDRLLASPHYGERWGRHWLDLARFAESHGYEQDYDRPAAYHYRDFVIQALNEDMAYDRFVRLQLAGDELEPDNPLALMATGFLGAGTHATQITANQVEKERYDELDDMTATTGTAFLGLTIGCARCHDHKFDPIPSLDYYRLLSTFTTTVRSEIDLDLHPERYREAKARFDAEHAPLVEALAKYEREELPARLDEWLNANKEIPLPAWLIARPKSIVSAAGATFVPQPDGSQLATGANGDSDTYTIVLETALAEIKAIRIEALADASLAKQGPGRAENGNFALSDVAVAVASKTAPDQVHAVKLVRPQATFEQRGLPIAAAIDDNPKSAWAVDPEFGKNHAAVLEFETPIGDPTGSIVTITLKFEGNKGHNIGRPRFAISASSATPTLTGGEAALDVVAAARQARAKSQSDRDASDRANLLAWHKTVDDRWQRLNAAVEEHLKQQPTPALTKVMVTSEGFTPIRFHTQGADFFEKSYILKRGDLNQKQAEATQGFLSVLMRSADGERHWQASPPAGWRTSYRRAALANWITDHEQGAGALAARVIVNRLWQHHFGRGIVGTPSDFGSQGEKPTHLELLEWLASQLVENGWHLKPLHKLMLTSSVYMQTADTDDERSRIDPDNRLLWRRNRQRLEAEIVRDAMLAASESLDKTMLGPGTLDEGHHRRSIYYTIKRSQMIPLMTLFDGPDALQGLGQRATTTVAPQALALLNNVNLQSYAHALAKAVHAEAPDSSSAAVRSAWLRALSRQPDDAELAEVLAFVAAQAESYRAAGKPDAAVLALADACQALMALNEFVYVE